MSKENRDEIEERLMKRFEELDDIPNLNLSEMEDTINRFLKETEGQLAPEIIKLKKEIKKLEKNVTKWRNSSNKLLKENKKLKKELKEYQEYYDRFDILDL